MGVSKERFILIEKGDVILFKNGKTRRVVEALHSNGTRVRKKPRVLLRFNKLSGKGTTLYTFGDLTHKIKGIFKQKSTTIINN